MNPRNESVEHLRYSRIRKYWICMDSLVYSTKDSWGFVGFAKSFENCITKQIHETNHLNTVVGLVWQIWICGLQIRIRTLRVQIGRLQIRICKTNPWIRDMNPRVNDSLIRFPHPYFFLNQNQPNSKLNIFDTSCFHLHTFVLGRRENLRFNSTYNQN